MLELQAEPACWRPFTGAGGAVLTLKPDLFAVTADAATETHSFIEVDRGTEHLPAILRKCQLYQAYQRTGREQQQREIFPSVTWLVPTPSRQQALTVAIAADPSLDRDLFWITFTDNALSLLAPYGSESITNRKEESS